MSSIKLDASGQRPVNVTLNDPARTAATVGTKAENMSVMLGGCSEFVFFLPMNARIERVRNGSGESLRVTVGDARGDSPRWESLSICGFTVQSQFPNAEITVRKEIDTFVRDLEALAVVQDRAGDWIPATEPEITTESI